MGSVIGLWRCARRLGSLCVLASVLVGCSDRALYSGLDEREANEMVETLEQAGLSAEKRGDISSGFSVSTASGGFSKAVGVLRRNGLPRERYETMGDVFAKEGFVSSPLEERARLNFAMSQEIAHTISSIDGVLMARVHLAVPHRDELDDTVAPASASVFVKHRASVDLTGSVGSIKALVVTGIENLPYENVTVVLFPAATGPATEMSDAAFEPAAEPPGTPLAQSATNTVLAAVAPFANPYSTVLLLLGGGLCVWFGWFGSRRARSANSTESEAAGTSLASAGLRGAKHASRSSRFGKR